MNSKLLQILFLSVFTVGFLAYAPVVFASTLYLSPGSGSVSASGTKSVQVRLSGQGDIVNGVSAYLSYPQDKLEVTSISYGGSAFSIAAENSHGGGSIRISRANLGGVGGDVNIATINFRGKAAGAATVAFVGGSSAPRASDSSDSLNLSGSRGATFTVGGSAPATTSPTPRPNPLLIQDIKVTEVSTNSAQISWKTNQKVATYLTYGIDKDQYLINTTETTPALDHKATVTGSLIIPGATYHFRIKAEDTQKNEWSSDDQTFHIPGYSLTVNITDENNLPLTGAEAEVFGYRQKQTTDQNGQVIFEDLFSGRNLLIVRINGQERTHELNIPDNPLSQTVSVQVAGFKEAAAEVKTPAPSNQILFGLFGLLIIILAVTIIIWKRRKIQTFTPPTTPV